MPAAAAWVLVALAAVLVGAAVPALLQLRRTLKAAEQTLETTGARVNETLAGLTTTLNQVNRAAGELERGVGQVSSLLQALGGIGDALVKVRSSVGAVASIGSVVGGAILAALGIGPRKHRDEPDPEAPVRDEPVDQEVKTR